MKRRKIKRLLALVMTGALVAGSAISVSAVEYSAPTQGMEANDNYVKASAYAASTVLTQILGLELTSSNGAGIYNSGGSSNAYGTDSSNLGIFGSDINSKPDAYLYNYFYNLNSTQSGSGDYSEDDMSLWIATPYTLRWDSNKQGPQGQASGSTTITIDGVTKTCNPAFYYEPDIIIGAESGYTTQLAAYQETYNSDYDPTIISAVSSSGTRSDGLGLEYNMFEMSANLVEIGEAVQEVEDETGKTDRYLDQNGTSTYETATDYDKYNRGLYYYAQSAFASGDLTEISYADSISYDSDSETWTVSSGNGRANQYASGIGTNIYDVLTSDEGYTFSDGTTINADSLSASTSADEDTSTDDSTTDDSSSDSGSTGGGSTDSGSTGGPGSGSTGGGSMGGGNSSSGSSSSSGVSLTTDQLIQILTVSDDEGNTYPGVVIGSAGSDEAYQTLQDAGISFLNNLPECVYGMTMQTTENGMGIAFYLSFFYYDQNEDLNPVSIIGYWIEHFYHVTDVDAMQTVITNMISNSDLNAAYTGQDELDINEYDEDAIEDLMIEGIVYYLDVVEPMLEVEETDSDSIAYWSTLDVTIGVGSDSTDTELLCAEDGHSANTNEGVVTDPTCTEEGYTTYVCSNCGETFISDLTATIDHNYVATSTTAATCTEQGYTTYTCSMCGDSYDSDYVDATGHSYEATTTDAGCTTQGYTTYTCSVCGDTYNDDYVSSTGHTYEKTETVAATCTTQGYTTYTCSVCGESYTADYTSATGHSYAEVRTVEPTSTEAGYTIYICTVCGETYTADYVSATGESTTDDGTTDNGTTDDGTTDDGTTDDGTTDDGTTDGGTTDDGTTDGGTTDGGTTDGGTTDDGTTDGGTTDGGSISGGSSSGGSTGDSSTSGSGISGSTGGDSTTLATQTITVKKTVTKTFKAKKLASKKKTFKISASTSGDGKITFTKKSGSAKLKISKAGKVTVKKGTYKKGKTLKMKVTVKAAATSTCSEATKTITVKVKIK